MLLSFVLAKLFCGRLSESHTTTGGAKFRDRWFRFIVSLVPVISSGSGRCLPDLTMKAAFSPPAAAQVRRRMLVFDLDPDYLGRVSHDECIPSAESDLNLRLDGTLFDLSDNL